MRAEPRGPSREKHNWLEDGSEPVNLRTALKVCSLTSIGLIAYIALGPANLQLRPMVGWKTEHCLGFMMVTFIACLAWPKPLVIGPLLIATAGLLEALQGLTPDRIPDLATAVSGAGGALVGSIAASVLIHWRDT